MRMRNKTIRHLSLVLALMLFAGVLAACNNGSGGSTQGSGQGGTSGNKGEKVTLQFYMLGDAPKDLPVIESEINKLAEADLNVNVKFNYTSWTDWDQKYKLLLSSGQPIDLIFTADWTFYQSYAKKGAFLPLDEMLPTAAPALKAHVPDDMWNAVKINDKIYTVPSTWIEYVTEGIAYREDLREKYNLPKPESLETLEAYLEGIKANEPNMIPIADSNANHTHGIRQLTSKLVNTAGQLPYGLDIMYDTPSSVTSYWGSAQHLEDLKTYKRWMDKGFFPKNVLNVKDTSNSLLQNGKAAVVLSGENPNKFNADVIKVQSTHPDWKLAYFPYPNAKGFAQPVHPIHNGFAIPRSSKNPEKALAFYEKLVTDKRYNWLTEYGVEGKNFEVDNGYYKMVGDAQTNGFPREGMNGWAWRNPEFMLYDKTFDDVLSMFEDLDKIKKPDIFTGFAEDWTPYQAEKAALEQVEKQYLYPLNVGLVADVEAGLNTFMEKAKQAGLEKIQAEYTKQWQEYLKSTGIQ
uniref:ABC transporter substrate-binding protein n=1 Tax=Paenibacillus sp. FSL k6-2145 TaxID=2976834 RepID=UPI00403F6417